MESKTEGHESLVTIVINKNVDMFEQTLDKCQISRRHQPPFALFNRYAIQPRFTLLGGGHMMKKLQSVEGVTRLLKGHQEPVLPGSLLRMIQS